MLIGVPPELGSDDKNGAIDTLLPSDVDSVSTGFAFNALNSVSCPRTCFAPNLNTRLRPKSSWFHRGSYRVPGAANWTVIAGSPANREGRTIAPGVQPGTLQSLGYRVEPRLTVQLKPPAAALSAPA